MTHSVGRMTTASGVFAELCFFQMWFGAIGNQLLQAS